MSLVLVVATAIATICGAILAAAALGRLLLSPMINAVGRIEAAVGQLEMRVEAGETEHHKDVKELWKYLAEHKS